MAHFRLLGTRNACLHRFECITCISMSTPLQKADLVRIVLQHAALPDLDDCTSFFGVYDGHGGKLCLFPIQVYDTVFVRFTSSMLSHLIQLIVRNRCLKSMRN